MIIVVRHASTNLNEGGDGKERIRGWMNVPLSKQGHQEALKTAREIKKLQLPIKDFHTSPLKRAMQTSNPIGSELGVEFDPDERLMDWNVGEFTGNPVDESLHEIFGYIDNPSKKTPGGESFNDFYNRCAPFLCDLVKDEKTHMVVTHNRVVTLAKALVDGGGEKPLKSTLKKKGPVEPGGILMIDPNWKMTIIHDHGASKG
jgi:alpha-ribazole phosphatase